MKSKITPELQRSAVKWANIANASDLGEPLDVAQLQYFQHIMRDEIQRLNDKLGGKDSDTKNCYPHNLNLRDFAAYIPLPSVVYQLEYPRQDRINWSYVWEMTAATFGVLGVMHVVSQAYIYPVVMACVEITEKGVPIQLRLREFPRVFGDLLFPLMMEYLLVWYVIWECIVSLSGRIAAANFSQPLSSYIRFLLIESSC